MYIVSCKCIGTDLVGFNISNCMQFNIVICLLVTMKFLLFLVIQRTAKNNAIIIPLFLVFNYPHVKAFQLLKPLAAPWNWSRSRVLDKRTN